jgi:hypothetical protein
LLDLCHEGPSSVDSPGCSTSPSTPDRILYDVNLDEAEPCRFEAVSPSAKPSTLPIAADFRYQPPTVRLDLVLIFPPQGQNPHDRVVTFHSRQNFGCRSRTIHAIDCFRFSKDPRGHRVSSIVRQTSDSTTLTLPVILIAEGTVMKYR